jgi:hypothetical protein
VTLPDRKAVRHLPSVATLTFGGRVRVRVVSISVLALALAGCGDSPTEPGIALEIVAAGGDGQFGMGNQSLDEPLEALVRRADTGEPQKGVPVAWTVESGAASFDTPAVGISDADGRVRASVRLGAGADTVRVRATLRDQPSATVTFEAYPVERPRLSALSVTEARAGDTVSVLGEGFSTSPRQNVVLFSGIRGRVVSATSTELRVEVPPCLPGRDVLVTTQLGSLVSQPILLSVQDAGVFTQLGVGGFLDVDEGEEIRCLRLAGGGPRYMVMPVATGTIGAGRYDLLLRGLGEGSVPPPSVAGRTSSSGSITSFGEEWEVGLREAEDRLVRAQAGGRARSGAQRAVSAVPSVGDRRSFKVLNSANGFDDVTAVARVVSDQAVIYVDERAPAGGYTDRDLEDFAASFDDVIYPTDTETFGFPSDLDGNDRVVILFTPTVNGLTPRGSQGFVGGFFYGLDLLDREGSNHAEIFYAIVPDPEGTYSDPRQKDRILQVVPGILAHEFQHMIHFNERVLKLGAPRTEALWLSEGLAQMAEELVGLAYERRGDFVQAQRFRDGNEDRARRFLAHTDSTSLIVGTGQGTLEERGAGWLFTLYLWDVWRESGILGQLTRTTRTGTENVAWVTGEPWASVFSDWGAALFLDGVATGPFPFEYPTVDLRTRLGGAPGPYPLSPEVIEEGNFTRKGSLWSSSVKHYIVTPPTAGGTVLRLGGGDGGNAPAEAGLRLRVVRIY